MSERNPAAVSGQTEQPGLKKVLGPSLLLLFIVGDILGTGVYALTGQVAGQVGGAGWAARLLAFGIAMPTALSYLELVTKYPRAARAAFYAHKAFGIHCVTFLVAFAVLCSGITSATTAARAVVAVAVVPVGELATSETPLLHVVAAGAPGLPIDGIFPYLTIFAVANTALINMLMASRLLYGMAHQRVLPSVFGKVRPGRRSPWVAILFTTLPACGLLVVVSLVLPEGVVGAHGRALPVPDRRRAAGDRRPAGGLRVVLQPLPLRPLHPLPPPRRALRRRARSWTGS